MPKDGMIFIGEVFMALSNRQLDVLDFIKRFIAKNGYSPTVREIGAGLSLKSPSTVQEHLKALVAQGIITVDKRKSRTIELLVQNEYLRSNEGTVKIPVLENAYKDIAKEFIEVPKLMLGDYDQKNLYAYKSNNSTFIVNASLAKPDRPSLTVADGVLSIEEIPHDEIFGNIIGEFKQY